MRTYVTATVAVAILVLISFIVVEALEIPLPTDPSAYLDDAGIVGAVVSVGLLLTVPEATPPEESAISPADEEATPEPEG